MEPRVAIIIVLLLLPLLIVQLRVQARALRHLANLRSSGYMDDNSGRIWSMIIIFGGFIGALYYLKMNAPDN